MELWRLCRFLRGARKTINPTTFASRLFNPPLVAPIRRENPYKTRFTRAAFHGKSVHSVGMAENPMQKRSQRRFHGRGKVFHGAHTFDPCVLPETATCKKEEERKVKKKTLGTTGTAKEVGANVCGARQTAQMQSRASFLGIYQRFLSVQGRNAQCLGGAFFVELYTVYLLTVIATIQQNAFRLG